MSEVKTIAETWAERSKEANEAAEAASARLKTTQEKQPTWFVPEYGPDGARSHSPMPAGVRVSPLGNLLLERAVVDKRDVVDMIDWVDGMFFPAPTLRSVLEKVHNDLLEHQLDERAAPVVRKLVELVGSALRDRGWPFKG